MTGSRYPDVEGMKDQRPSLLPFNPADLVAMRVLPAQFAALVGVSKQSVSRWIKKGIVTLGPDGKIDPSIGAREVIQKTDPNRMRARVFKSALSSHRELQKRILVLENEIQEFKEVEHYRLLMTIHRDDMANNLCVLTDQVIADFPNLADAYRAGKIGPLLDSIVAGIFYPQTNQENETESDEAPTAPSAKENMPETP